MSKNLGFGPNFVRGLKGFGVSFTTSIIVFFLFWVSRYVMTIKEEYAIGIVIGLASILAYFVVWGWLAYKFFKWK